MRLETGRRDVLELRDRVRQVYVWDTRSAKDAGRAVLIAISTFPPLGDTEMGEEPYKKVGDAREDGDDAIAATILERKTAMRRPSPRVRRGGKGGDGALTNDIAAGRLIPNT